MMKLGGKRAGADACHHYNAMTASKAFWASALTFMYAIFWYYFNSQVLVSHVYSFGGSMFSASVMFSL